MTTRKKFNIPSISEIEDADSSNLNEFEPAFKKHKEVPGDDTTSSASSSKGDKTSGGIHRNTAVSKTTTVAASSSYGVQGTVSSNGKSDSSAGQKCLVVNETPTTMPSDGIIHAAGSGSDTLKGSSTTSKIGSSNCLVVNPRQRGNPILKSVRNVPWEYGNIIPDYVMGQSNCALFLSLRYHQLHPNYIHDRLKQLGRSYELRVILVQVDVKEPHQILKELAKICILADCTLVLAFTPEEAGRYLETYKVFENKPPEAIMEKTEDNFMAKFIDCLTRVKSVNKTDCSTLLAAFGSLANVIDAKEEDLSLCPGFGPQKAKRLHSLFYEPFLRNPQASKRKDTETSSHSEASSSALS